MIDYLTHLEGLGKTDKYVRQVQSVLRRFAADPAKAQSLVNRYAQQRSDASTQHVVTVLRSYGRWASIAELQRLVKPARRTGRTAEPGSLEPEHVEALTTDERIPAARRDLYLIAARTGLRPVEIRRINPDRDIVQTEPDVFVLRLPASAQKSRRADTLPLPFEVEIRLRTGAYARLTDWGWRNLAETMRCDLAAVGIEQHDSLGRRRTFYSLRGYFGAQLLDSGVKIHVAQRLMRHAKAETTLKWYSRPSDRALREAMEGIA